MRSSLDQRVKDLEGDITSKQDTLVSGTNIKTINGNSLLGSGNISISGATLADGDYGDITVGSSGTTMTIDNSAVTNAKINDVAATKVTQDSTHRFVTDTEKNTWNSKLDPNTPITGATKTKITYDADGLVTSGADATTSDISDSTNKRYVTDAQLTVIGNTSGTNTGDETTSTIKTKLGAATAGSDGYLTSTDWSTFNSKQNALTNPVTGTGTDNEIAAFNSTGSTITSLSTATYPSLTELAYVKGVTSKIQDQLNAKEPTITNGFGITGTTTKAVGLTNSQAFCTATTSISAATYADITGASITLAAGTWLIMATANVYAANTAFIAHIAITDGANTVIAEGSQGMPASGTASVNQWGNVSLSAIVTPAGSTTYKLRGARGNTTITGTYTVADGAGTGTTNNTTDNTDKGTVIMAVRIA